jgi:capsular exopolysaccharide synthesis family protein
MSTAAPVSERSATNDQRRRKVMASETFSQVQSLAQRIHAMLTDERTDGHIVGVTSCNRREGVSVVAENLAVCTSELYAGNVLLIDANPRHASVAKRFAIDQTIGLADCLRGEASVMDCIAETNQLGLSVLPAGNNDPSSSRVSHEHAANLFNELRQHFETIVVDLPPAGKMDETFAASKLFDGILLAIEAERVRRQVAMRVKRQLEQVNARLLGVVLNKRMNYIPEWLYRRL